jgi:hypothetical protein
MKKEAPVPKETRGERALRIRAQAPDPAREAFLDSLRSRDRERLAFLGE